MPESISKFPDSEIILYQTEDGKSRIEVRLVDKDVWLTQASISKLYQTSKQNISLHLRNIFSDGELKENSVVKQYLTTALDGKRYNTKHYNLEAIIAVGYRVRSHRGTQFRKWATERLREYLVKGFTLDDERLKEGYHLGADYFDEISELNRIVSMYLDFAEDQARRRKPIYMKDWREKLNAFLKFNEREILENAGEVSMEVAKSLAEKQYESFNKQRLITETQKAEKELDNEFNELTKKIQNKNGDKM